MDRVMVLGRDPATALATVAETAPETDRAMVLAMAKAAEMALVTEMPPRP